MYTSEASVATIYGTDTDADPATVTEGDATTITTTPPAVATVYRGDADSESGSTTVTRGPHVQYVRLVKATKVLVAQSTSSTTASASTVQTPSSTTSSVSTVQTPLSTAPTTSSLSSATPLYTNSTTSVGTSSQAAIISTNSSIVLIATSNSTSPSVVSATPRYTNSNFTTQAGTATAPAILSTAPVASVGIQTLSSNSSSIPTSAPNTTAPIGTSSSTISSMAAAPTDPYAAYNGSYTDANGIAYNVCAGADSSGPAYNSTSEPSVSDCFTDCDSQPTCAYFTFVPYGAPSGNGTCSFKNGTGSCIFNNTTRNMLSGFRENFALRPHKSSTKSSTPSNTPSATLVPVELNTTLSAPPTSLVTQSVYASTAITVPCTATHCAGKNATASVSSWKTRKTSAVTPISCVTYPASYTTKTMTVTSMTTISGQGCTMSQGCASALVTTSCDTVRSDHIRRSFLGPGIRPFAAPERSRFFYRALSLHDALSSTLC